MVRRSGRGDSTGILAEIRRDKAREEHASETMLEVVDHLASALEASGGTPPTLAEIREVVIAHRAMALGVVVVKLAELAAAMEYGERRRLVAEAASAIEDLA